MFSNLSTFRENAKNGESDQTGLLGGGGGLLMDQSNPCVFTPRVILQSLTWPQDQIQSTLVISTSVILNNRLSRRENLVLVLIQKSIVRFQYIFLIKGVN